MTDSPNDSSDQTSGQSLDALTTKAFSDFSQKFSRRSVLGKIGRLSLGVLGISVFQEVLPVNRSTALAATVGCNHKSTCGLTGYQCGCTDCSGDNTQCPNCACLGNSWVCCCCDINDCDNQRYLDCYNTSSCPSGKLAACNSCASCSNYPGASLYRGTCTGAYMCTRIRETTSCSGIGC